MTSNHGMRTTPEDKGSSLIAAATSMRRLCVRLRWWWVTRGCECHWREPFGPVVMGGCPRHD